MYCNKCGNEINENERFCKYCGAPVEKLDEQVNGEKLDESLQKQTKKKIKWPVFNSGFDINYCNCFGDCAGNEQKAK